MKKVWVWVDVRVCVCLHVCVCVLTCDKQELRFAHEVLSQESHSTKCLNLL